jgi:hypothetical protein
MFAVMAIFARIARITSCARSTYMNLRAVSWCIGCCCLRDARERACEYYDDCNSFHRFWHHASGAFQRASLKTEQPTEKREASRSIYDLDFHHWVNFPSCRTPRMMKTILAEVLDSRTHIRAAVVLVIP